jgi:hypothetical protein
MKFFIDITKTDGSKVEGTIAWPSDDALAEKARIKMEHPDWHVELNPLEGTNF